MGVCLSAAKWVKVQPGAIRDRVHVLGTEGVLLIIAILLLLLWGGGFAFHVGGGLIHLLLLIALIVFILNFVRGGRSF